MKTAVVLAPHTDDGELGCGATIARLSAEGWSVSYHAFSVPEPVAELAREVRAATTILGVDRLTLHDFPTRRFDTVRQDILDVLVDIDKEAPEAVFMPSLNDVHQDHAVVAKEALRAFKRRTLLGYELPWNCFHFKRQAYYVVGRRHLEAKLAALAEYRSQSHRAYTSAEYTRSLLVTRGVEAGSAYAEAFEVERVIFT